MATAGKNKSQFTPKQNLYPVWVGNLHDEVTDSVLKQRFSGFGAIDSCKIMRDGKGQSKHFAYVNFFNKAKAETAARKLNGFEFLGKPIKTKGPSVLKTEGHLKKKVNYRPLTDCAFYVEGKVCKHGKECPYRHSDVAHKQTEICQAWLQKKCNSKSCPKRHPGNLQRSSRNSEGKLFLSCSSSGSHQSLDFSDSEDSFDNEVLLPDDEDIDTSSTSSPPSSTHNMSLSMTPPNLFNRKPRPQGPYSPSSVTKGVGQSFLPASPKSTQSFTMSSDDEMDSEGESGSDEFGSYSPFPDDEDDDDLNLSSQPESFTRLMSLKMIDENGEEEDGWETESEEEEIGGEDVVAKETSQMRSPVSGHRKKPVKSKVKTEKDNDNHKTTPTPDSKAPVHAMHVPVQLEPVGLFWDIENCPVPVDKSAFFLANKMRNVFFQGKREAEFMCVCDIHKESKDVINDLNKAHVTLVHVNAIAKNAADDKLRHSLRRFANTFSPPATVVLVSGDINFSPELNDLRHVHNITVYLVHNAQASEALKVCAHKTILFDEFLKDVDRPQQQVIPTASTVLVHQLPRIENGKIRNRLSRLADNCGGKVLKIDNGTARVLFRSKELAMKAQRRMNGEDVFGSKIVVVLENSTMPPVPSPQRVGHIVPRPMYQPSNPMFRPGPMRPPFPPRPPFNIPPPHVLPPFHRMPFPPPPPPPPPLAHVPSPPKESSFKFYVIGVPVKGEGDFGKLISLFTEIRLAVKIKSLEPEFLWESFSKVSILSVFDILRTAQIRNEHTIVQMLSQGNTPIKIIQQFVATCFGDIKGECQRRNLMWNITVCKWSIDEEEDKRVRSNVISLLCKYDKHWCRWEMFKTSYGQTYQRAISEMMVQNTCKEAIQILGASADKDEVIVFSELSPVTRVQPSQELKTKIFHLLKLLPQNRIRIIEFVEAYQTRFGLLPRLKRRGKLLQDVLSSLPELLVRGSNPATMLVELREKAPVAAPVVGGHKLLLEQISNEFVKLLREAPGQQIHLMRLQQEYQTAYHKSFRVSDILPGETGMRNLIDACHGIKCLFAKIGTKREPIVILDTSSKNRINNEAIPRKESLPFKSKPEPRPKSPVFQPQASSLKAVPEDESIKKFKREMTELLSTVPNRSIQVNRIPEAFSQHFHRPYLLTEYGGRKTSLLLQKIPDVVKITGEGNEKIIELIAAGNGEELTKNDCEMKIEELLYHLPNNQTTLDRFLFEYETYFKEKLPSNYCGYSKLINLLQDMKSTINIAGTGPQRVIFLHPIRVFACEMRQLLSDHPDGLMFPFIVPQYKEKFDRDFSAEKYGKSKLIQVMESIPDVVEIIGHGARRFARLVQSTPPTCTSSSSTLHTSNPTPIPEGVRQLFLDEITSLLLQHKENRMTLEQLSARYYNTFNKQINFNQLGCSSLHEAVQDLPNVQVIRNGASRVVQLVTESVVEPKKRIKQQSNEKETDSQSEQSVSESDQTGTSLKPDQNIAEPHSDHNGLELKSDTKETSMQSLEVSSSQKYISPPFVERTCLRLLSETHRLLLTHHEHSMTLDEICEAFVDTDDPAVPNAENLLDCIKIYADKKTPHHFVVSKPTPDIAMVSLPLLECILKLSKDLQYLFVYRPSSDFKMSIDEMTDVYQECHAHKLNPMIYRHKHLDKLLKHKVLKPVIQFDEETKTVSLSLKARRDVFCQLACELLFRKGQFCISMEIFMNQYNKYYHVPLSLEQLRAETLEDLVSSEEITAFVKVDPSPQKHLTLTSRGLYCEQLRHLLTMHNGRIPQDLLLTIYLSQYHRPQDPEILNWLHKKPIRYASHIVHLAAEFFIIWAPTGHPYPNTRSEEQSMEPPDEHSVTLRELAAVPDVLRSMVTDPLPTSITLDFFDEEFFNLPIIPSEDTGEEQETIETKENGISSLPGFSVLSEDVGTIDKEVPTGILIDMETPSNNTDDNDEITGLDYGEFAGMTHQSVLEKMKEEMRSNEDARTKLKLMSTYLDYFGELSGREIERVEGPQTKPKKPKGKRKLAIRFPGQSLEDSKESEVPPVITKEKSPRTSPTLEKTINDGVPVPKPDSDTFGFLPGIQDRQQDSIFGDKTSDNEPLSPGTPTEWPLL